MANSITIRELSKSYLIKIKEESGIKHNIVLTREAAAELFGELGNVLKEDSNGNNDSTQG